MKVRDLMTPNPITITPADDLTAAIGAMLKHRIHELPVVEDGLLLGILTDRDIALGVWWEWSQTGTWPCGSWATDGMAPAFR